MSGQAMDIKVTDHGVCPKSSNIHETSGHRVPQVAASGTAMRTFVREPDRSPQDVVPSDRLDIKAYLADKRSLVEEALALYLPAEEGPLSRHIAAMRYSLLAGGKRLRPVLALASAQLFDRDPAPLLPVACALECIHTYSLIHDDLPAMDNDDLRRGKPTCHVAFGEAEAILAGDGLLSFAFELLCHPVAEQGIPAATLVRMVRLLAIAIGPVGMVGGQCLDLAAEGRSISLEELQQIHRLKTGALIAASIEIGALFGQATEEEFTALSRYGRQIGLAFQIVDDLLDVEGSTAQLGKTVGADLRMQKATYPAFFGVEKTRELAREAVDSAVKALDVFDERAEPLRALARYILDRDR